MCLFHKELVFSIIRSNKNFNRLGLSLSANTSIKSKVFDTTYLFLYYSVRIGITGLHQAWLPKTKMVMQQNLILELELKQKHFWNGTKNENQIENGKNENAKRVN